MPRGTDAARSACEVTEYAEWRSGPELNRHSRICSPLHHHSATGPPKLGDMDVAMGQMSYIGRGTNAVKCGGNR